jgi:hypothetical protein
MPDDQVQFRSPTTGKVQAVPQENWDDALKQGYVPTTHKVMYSPDGKRGMVPNSDLKDYTKQGYQTTPKTQFEQNVTGEGISLKGSGKATYETLKKSIPEGPDTSSVWNLLVGHPKFDPASGGIAQAAGEAQSAAQRGDVSPVVAGLGSLVGVSAQQQAENAAHGEGGKIIGETGVPAGAAALSLAAPAISESVPKVPGKIGTALRTETGALKPSVHTAARVAGTAAGHMLGVPGLGELGGYAIGPGLADMIIPKRPGGLPPPPTNPFSPAAVSSATPVGSAELPVPTGNPTPFPRVMTKAELAAQARAAAKPVPPNPFAGATSSAAPIGNAPLPAPPAVPPTTTGAPVQGNVIRMGTGVGAEELATLPPNGKTSLLSRGRTLVEPGLEPDLNNPVHVKMINDYQTMSGPALRQLASAGDRFAAFVLRHMPRP